MIKSTDELEIVEIIKTISGEAPFAGFPVLLIRFSKCNLKCTYCDTINKNEINFKYTPDELKSYIAEVIHNYPAISVLFTGGEPLFHGRQSIINNIISSFSETEFYIESNGSVEIIPFNGSNRHLVLDWKSPSSGEVESFLPNNLSRLNPDNDIMKLVVGKDDLEWALNKIEFIKDVNSKIPVYLSPQWGEIELPELASFIIDNNLPAAISLQLHKIIWGMDSKGV